MNVRYDMKDFIANLINEDPNVVNRPVIFCDLDGVLVDLESAIKFENFEKAEKSEIYYAKCIRDTIMYRIVLAKNLDLPIEIDQYPQCVSDFWSSLSWISGGRKLWNHLRSLGLEIRIISARPLVLRNCEFKGTVEGKSAWCERELEIDRSLVNVVPYRTKGIFATQIDGILPVLIDDAMTNIKDWRENGGLAIHHIDADKTISELQELFK